MAVIELRGHFRGEAEELKGEFAAHLRSGRTFRGGRLRRLKAGSGRPGRGLGPRIRAGRVDVDRDGFQIEWSGSRNSRMTPLVIFNQGGGRQRPRPVIGLTSRRVKEITVGVRAEVVKQINRKLARV